MAVSAEELGTEDIKLLIKQAAPASIDFIHVRQYTSRLYLSDNGSVHLLSRNCGLTNNILYFIVRMAIGIGGGSVLSRALVQNQKKQAVTF
jgi:hypothetical protein